MPYVFSHIFAYIWTVRDLACADVAVIRSAGQNFRICCFLNGSTDFDKIIHTFLPLCR